MCKNPEAEPTGIARERVRFEEFSRFRTVPATADRAVGFRRSLDWLLALDVHPEIGSQLDGADAGVHADQRHEDVKHPGSERARTLPKLVRVGIGSHLDDAGVENFDGMAEALDFDGDTGKGLADEVDEGGAVDLGLVLVGASRAA